MIFHLRKTRKSFAENEPSFFPGKKAARRYKNAF